MRRLNRFIAGDRTAGGAKGPEMLARLDPAFDSPVILFQNIIEVLYRSMPAILLESALGFEPHDGGRVSGVFIGVDDPRRRMVFSVQRFGQEALGCRCIAFS